MSSESIKDQARHGGSRNLLAYRVQLALKRFMDIVLCLIVIVLGWPLLALLALAVRLSSPGPVFFVQPRVGKGEKVFRLIKFRTMTGRPDENATTWTEADEARITRIGAFLRDYGLDELPQVLNILRGDMSIVGPRPPLPIQVEDHTDRQRRMFLMRPGVLSLAAVEGRRSIPMERRIELHTEYVENWSLSLDLSILWRSLLVVLRRQDVVEVISSQEASACEF